MKSDKKWLDYYNIVFKNLQLFVDINDTIKGFNAIIDGEYDHLPEAAFNLVGTIEDAVLKGEKILAEVAK